MRLLTCTLFLFCGLILFALLLILPSRVLLSIQDDEYSAERDIYSQSISSANSKDLMTTLDDIKSMVTLAAPEGGSLFAVISKVLEKKDSGIKITSFSYTRGASAPSSLSIQGVAAKRSDLLTFYRALQKEKIFTKVDLPVASLAKESEAPFSLALLGAF